MASIISAGTTTGTAIAISGDTTGNLAFQTQAGANTITVPNGTGTIAVQGVSTNIVSGTAVASTSGTSIDFTSIPSWVKRVTINFESVSTNGSSPFIVRIGAGSIITSGYNGSWAYISGSSTSQYFINTGFGLVNVPNASYAQSGIATLSLLGSNVWCYSSNVSIDTAAAAMYFGSGSLSVGGTLDRVRITTVNGTDTFDAGTINILYE